MLEKFEQMQREMEEMKQRMEKKSDRTELQEMKQTMMEIKRLRRAADAGIIADMKQLIRDELYAHNRTAGT